MHLIGRSGTGKTTLMRYMIMQDFGNGEGACVIDPHGDLIESLKAEMPEHRKKEVVDFDLGNPNLDLRFNPLESTEPGRRPLIASGLIDVFKQLFGDSWGPRLEHILRNVLLTLLDQPVSSLEDIPRVLQDRAYSKQACLRVRNRHVQDFWLKEFWNYSPRFQNEAISPVLNKIGAFLSNPVLSRVLCHEQSSFDMSTVMNDGKILLVNLSKGKVGADSAKLIGGLLMAKMSQTAMERSNIPEQHRRDFYLYCDEFPTYSPPGMAEMLSELRKYRLSLVLAHQFLAQLDRQVMESVLSNVGTLIAFRVGVTDAEVLEKEFYPDITANDMVSLGTGDIYLKLMIRGKVSDVFSAESS